MICSSNHRTAQAKSTARATPEGGACRWRVRGRAIALLFSLTASSALAQSEISLPVPSGQPVHLKSVLLDNNPGELWVRFRFIAPKIGATVGRIGYDVASKDMAHLCQTLAIVYVEQHRLDPALIIISFADRPIEFGDTAPDATQFFEAYRLEQSGCVWEGF